ncbi:MAG: 30S ribosomal protein S18 [Planctomycetota bacterium]
MADETTIPDASTEQSRPQRPRIAQEGADGKFYVDYKKSETLRRLISTNGKMGGRRRSGANAMEQRKIATAIKRARYMALLPYTSHANIA